MSNPISKPLIAGALLTLLIFAPRARGQSYTIDWSTIDGGGVTFASGGPYSLGGTIGQPDAGVLTGGAYAVTGGFWALAPASGDCGRVSIRRIGNNVEVSWPADNTGCVLEQSSSLGGTMQWIPVSPAPVGPLHVASASDGPRFYRLRKP